MSETHTHWSEQLADRVIAEKKEPYVITAGMTTSGPVHFGTLCEMLFPYAIKRALEKKGRKAEYYFIADILDAFDSVPLAMERYKAELTPHLGKPLCDVPDPTGRSASFGDHFLDEARGLMERFGIDAKVVRINEYYREGKFDQMARFFLAHEDEARRIVEETSGKTEKKDWSPLMPICAKCGRIATTRVLGHTSDSYKYICDKDVRYTKGCGFEGEDKLSDHRYKIVWRLHWPAWKQIFHSSIEGAGMDHHTKGGSEDTCCAITKDLLKAEYHIPYKYGFILYQGKKYSKSKGTGMGISEISRILPPSIIKYMLLRPDLEENVDIDPTPEKILRTIEDFEHVATLDPSSPGISRSDRKKAVAYGLSTEKRMWKAPFLDILLYSQLYRDWDRVKRMTGDIEGVDYLRPFIEQWEETGFMPEDYNCRYQPDTGTSDEEVKGFISSLQPAMDALAVHNGVFDYAKERGIAPKEMFARLYQALIGKERGPRMGKLVTSIGIGTIKADFGL